MDLLRVMDLLRIVRERWRVISVGLLAGLLLALAVTVGTRPVYESATTLIVNGQVTLTDNSQAEAQNTLSQNLVGTYAELIRTRPIAEAVVQRLRLRISPAGLQDRLSTVTTPGTSLLTLHATAGSAAEARQIAQAVAEEFTRRAAVLMTPERGRPPVRVEVVEPASLPGVPIAPKPLRNLCIGGLLGFLVGLAMSVLRDRNDQRVRSADGLERASGIAVLATVPRVRRPMGMVGPELSNGAPVAEAYRQLRTRLLSAGPGVPRSVLVAGPVAGDGKTTTACYLAAVLARANRRVILVDGDLRRPRVAQAMGLSGRTGLVDVLLQRTDLTDAVQQWDHGHLHVLTAGEPTSQASELLAAQAMVDLMRQLHRSYEFVVVDSPAMIAVADAEILSTLVGDVLLVLRYTGTPQARVEEAVHNLCLVGARLLGAVITAVPRRAARQLRFPSAAPTTEPVPRPASVSLLSEPERQPRVPNGRSEVRVVDMARVPGARADLASDAALAVPTIGHSTAAGSTTTTTARPAGNQHPTDHGDG